GQSAAVYVADEVHDNQFRIAGGRPGLKVSWQVTGIRHDPYALAHPIVVEEEKPPALRGRLLHPGLYGLPGSAGFGYAKMGVRQESTGGGVLASKNGQSY